MRALAPIVAVVILAIFLAPVVATTTSVPYALPAAALFALLVGVPLAARRLHERGDPKTVQKTALLAIGAFALAVVAAFRALGA